MPRVFKCLMAGFNLLFAACFQLFYSLFPALFGVFLCLSVESTRDSLSVGRITGPSCIGAIKPLSNMKKTKYFVIRVL